MSATIVSIVLMIVKLRDLRMIGYKLKYVLMPKMREEKGKELRNCTSYIKINIRGFMGSIDPLPNVGSHIEHQLQ